MEGEDLDATYTFDQDVDRFGGALQPPG